MPLAFVMGACSSFSSFFSPLPFRGCTLLIGNTARREIQLVALHTHASLTLRRPPRRWFIYSVDEKGATKSQHCRKAETRPIHFKSEIKKKVPTESVGDDVRTIQLESAVSETKSLVLFIPFDWAAGPILSLSLSRSRWSEPRTDVTSWISLPAPMQEERERERETSPNAILILGFSLSILIAHSNCSLSASVFLARTDFIYVRRSINLWLVTHYSAERPELISNAELSRDAGRRPGRGDPVQLPSVHPNRRDLPLIIYETTELPVIGLAVQLKGQPEWRSLTTYWQSWQKEEGSYWNIWDVQGAKFFSQIHGIYVTVTAAKIPLFFSPFVRDALPPCRLPPIRNQETRGVTWVPYRLRAADFVTYPRPFILPFFFSHSSFLFPLFPAI